MTQPTSWSSAATLAATRIFASNLSAKMAQRWALTWLQTVQGVGYTWVYKIPRTLCTNPNCARYYNLVLLPHVLRNIEDHKKLDFHLYTALKKSLYKPAAFFKGILLPMCEVKLLQIIKPTRALLTNVRACMAMSPEWRMLATRSHSLR